ncbi:MAG: hypothetical protein V4649_06420 [Bacteroidota bacterium]
MTRSTKQFLYDVTTKPPILFPLVAGFHIFWLLITLWGDRHEPFPNIVWLEILWMIGYTAFWIAASDFRKWGANGYIVLTLLNTTVYLLVKSGKAPIGYLSNMFLLDGLFSVFLMFYYKHFR